MVRKRSDMSNPRAAGGRQEGGIVASVGGVREESCQVSSSSPATGGVLQLCEALFHGIFEGGSEGGAGWCQVQGEHAKMKVI